MLRLKRTAHRNCRRANCDSRTRQVQIAVKALTDGGFAVVIKQGGSIKAVCRKLRVRLIRMFETLRGLATRVLRR